VRKRTDSLEAYDYFLRGQEYFWRYTKDSIFQARQMYEKAIELDLNYGQAYAGLSWTYWLTWFFQWSQEPQALEQAFNLAQKAVALDDSLPAAHTTLGYVYLMQRKHDQAIVECERAIAVDPNWFGGYVSLGDILIYSKRPEETIGLMKTALRLSPRLPSIAFNILGFAYLVAGQYEEATLALKKALSHNPNLLPAHMNLAVVYSERGQREEARAETAEVLRLSPHVSLDAWKQRLPFKDPAVLERYLAALRKAGLK
jgi:tetratricopeptide (TPR) repeat protein